MNKFAGRSEFDAELVMNLTHMCTKVRATTRYSPRPEQQQDMHQGQRSNKILTKVRAATRYSPRSEQQQDTHQGQSNNKIFTKVRAAPRYAPRPEQQQDIHQGQSSNKICRAGIAPRPRRESNP